MKLIAFVLLTLGGLAVGLVIGLLQCSENPNHDHQNMMIVASVVGTLAGMCVGAVTVITTCALTAICAWASAAFAAGGLASKKD